MQIGGDNLWFGVVKLLEIGDDAAKGGVRLFGFQVADVLADENLIADRKRDGVFEMRSHCQNDPLAPSLSPPGGERVSAGRVRDIDLNR